MEKPLYQLKLLNQAAGTTMMLKVLTAKEQVMLRSVGKSLTQDEWDNVEEQEV